MLIATMLGLAGCAGVSIGVPIGGVTIGTTVMGNGGVAVGASTRGGSVGMSGRARSHPAFEDVPEDDKASSSDAEGDKAEDGQDEAAASKTLTRNEDNKQSEVE